MLVETRKTIGLICPYFGRLDQDHMKLWFQSCAYNMDIDFILITDDKEIEGLLKPDNVHCHYLAWDSCKKKIQSHYDFNVPLVYKYKICDLKPAFGEIFREYLEGYDYWGHIDVSDTIFGNLRRFITDDLLESYDKIHMFGHLILYKNTEEVNVRYRIPLKSGKSYRDVFAVEETMCFDEMYHEISINQIYKENKYRMIDRIPGLVVDILPYYWNFRLSQDKEVIIPRIIEWDKGTLNEIILEEGQIIKNEIGYVHYQKRRITSCLKEGTDHYYIIPNRIIAAESVTITAEWMMTVSEDKVYWAPVKYRAKRIISYAKYPKVFIRKLLYLRKQGR